VKEAEAHAQEDKQRRDEIEARNAADARAYAEKQAAAAQANDAGPGSANGQASDVKDAEIVDAA
jgi:hypothetical protein